MPEINYLWDPISDNIVRELDENGNVLVEYTHEPGLHGRLISEHRNGVTYQHHYDGQGNTVALTDDNGNVTDTFAYSAFGEVTERSGTTETPFQYGGEHGYYWDEVTGELMVRRRQLDSGRWLSLDPLMFADGINRFVYVRNNPIIYVDPSGLVLFACDVHPQSFILRYCFAHIKCDIVCPQKQNVVIGKITIYCVPGILAPALVIHAAAAEAVCCILPVLAAVACVKAFVRAYADLIPTFAGYCKVS